MILGITGHQDLKNFDEYWIRKSLKDFIVKNIVLRGLSSLAIGADQLFANELRSMKIKYDVIIPCSNYESTFKTENDLINYLALKDFSENKYTLNFQQPSEQAFYAGGMEIVNRSSTIIAIWDGEKAKGLGGTGDIVKLALEVGKSVYQINPVNQTHAFLKND